MSELLGVLVSAGKAIIEAIQHEVNGDSASAKQKAMEASRMLNDWAAAQVLKP